MSANNWAKCTNCEKVWLASMADTLSELEAAYGKLPPKEWLAKKAEIETRATPDMETFREDYEIGISSNGDFEVDYRGACDRCGMKMDFTHRAAIIPPKPKATA